MTFRNSKTYNRNRVHFHAKLRVKMKGTLMGDATQPFFFFLPPFTIEANRVCLACIGFNFSELTVIILNIGTDMSGQTVQTQIRLLLVEQSDQGLLCLLFCLHLLNTILHCKIQPFQW